MTTTTVYDFTSGTGFTYDPTKIGFNGTSAALLLQTVTGEVFTPAIASSSFNASLLGYVTGGLQQVDQRPANATFYAPWTSALNAAWSGAGNGGLTVSAFGGAAISAGVLNLKGQSGKYVTWVATGNCDFTQQGSIEFQIIPGASGPPASLQEILGIATVYGGFGNLIQLVHNTSGHLVLTIYDHTGGTPILNAVDLGAWSPVGGTTYTFLLQVDITNGATKLFINGVQQGATQTGTGTRSTPIAYAVVGADTIGDPGANFSILNFAAYSAIVTPASAVLPPTIYDAATAILPAFAYGGAANLLAWTAAVITDSGSPGYTLNGLYWSGFAWVASDGTYAQASLAAAVIANIATLPTSNALQIDAIYNVGATQAKVSAFAVTYTGQIYPTSQPTIYPTLPLSMDVLQSFAAVLAASGSDGVQFYLLEGSTPMWWSGAAWAVSNGTYAQTNPAAVIMANAGALLAPGLGAFVTPVALLNSATGATTPSLTSVTVIYQFFGQEPAGPNTCRIFGYVLDPAGNGIAGAIVSVQNPSYYDNQGWMIAPTTFQATTNAEGYFYMDVGETTTANVPYAFSITPAYPRGGDEDAATLLGSALIPNQPSVNFATLTFS